MKLYNSMYMVETKQKVIIFWQINRIDKLVISETSYCYLV